MAFSGLDLYQLLDLALKGLTLLAVPVTLWFYFSQRSASKRFANLPVLIQLLESPDVREARFVLMRELPAQPQIDKPWPDSEMTNKAAATSLAAYDLLAVLVNQKQVDRKIAIRHWGHSAYRLASMCIQFIHKRQKENNSPEYFGQLIGFANDSKRMLGLDKGKHDLVSAMVQKDKGSSHSSGESEPASEHGRPSMNLDRKTEVARSSFEIAERRISMLDNKSNVMMAVLSAILVAVSFFVRDFILSLNAAALRAPAYVFLFLVFGTSLASIYFLLMTVRPAKGFLRFRTPETKTPGERNPLSFTAVSEAKTEEEYLELFSATSDQGYFESLVKMARLSNRLLSRKYDSYRPAMWLVKLLVLLIALGLLSFFAAMFSGIIK